MEFPLAMTNTQTPTGLCSNQKGRIWACNQKGLAPRIPGSGGRRRKGASTGGKKPQGETFCSSLGMFRSIPDGFSANKDHLRCQITQAWLMEDCQPVLEGVEPLTTLLLLLGPFPRSPPPSRVRQQASLCHIRGGGHCESPALGTSCHLSELSLYISKMG